MQGKCAVLWYCECCSEDKPYFLRAVGKYGLASRWYVFCGGGVSVRARQKRAIGETLHKSTHTRTNGVSTDSRNTICMYTCIYYDTYMYTYIYVLCVCVCACMRVLYVWLPRYAMVRQIFVTHHSHTTGAVLCLFFASQVKAVFAIFVLRQSVMMKFQELGKI